MLQRIYRLILKDLIIELRNPYALGGILLYLVSCVFVVYKAFNTLDPQVWNALYWVLFLFVGISAMLNSFIKESGKSALFYYSLFNPYELLLAKLIYNFILMFVLSGALFAILNLFIPVPMNNGALFIKIVFLACLGISINFGFISAIATQGSQNSTLMSILAFPIVIPILLVSLKVSAQAIGIINDSTVSDDLLIVIAVDIIMLGLALILFPFLWKS